jgi:hypothetical protein
MAQSAALTRRNADKAGNNRLQFDVMLVFKIFVFSAVNTKMKTPACLTVG